MDEPRALTSSDSLSHFSPVAEAREVKDHRLAKSSQARWATLLIALPSAVLAVSYLRLLIKLITVHNELYPEGACVFGFMTAFQTHRLYLPPYDFPWNAQFFGPLFVMTGTFIANVFHGEATPITVAMRSVSFAALLGSLVLVGYIGWKLERQKAWAAVAIVLGLGCSWLCPYAAAARPDTLPLFLVLAALVIYVASEGKLRRIYLAGIVGTAAFLTKQSSVPVLLALFIDLLWARKVRETAVFVAGGITTAAVVFVPLWLRHEPFLANFTAIRNVTQDWHSIPSVVLAAFRVNQIAAICIAIAILGAVISLKHKRYRCVLLLVVFTWLFNLAALANVGGGPHYLISPWILTMLLVPAGLKQLEDWAARALWIPAAIFLLGTVIVVHQRSLLWTNPAEGIDARPVANLTMLTDLPYIELRSKQPQLLDTFTYNEFVKQRVWQDTPIRERIDSGNYDLLLIGGQKEQGSATEFFVENFRGTSLWGADLLGEMTAHYRVLCETKDYLAMVPANRTSPVSVTDIAEIFHQPCRASIREPKVAPGNS